MATYSKSLEDYFRIPILIKPLNALNRTSQAKVQQSLYYKYYSLTIDQRYTRQQQNPNTDILINRDPCVQKMYFVPEEINNDWSEYQVVYKVRYAIGIIDQTGDEKTILETLAKLRLQNSIKLIGILDMGATASENLIKKQNLIKYPNLEEHQFRHFIEPWLYNCLSMIESDICNIIAEVKRDDQTNRTIVFNRMEDKFDPKIIKKKKKYRCLKLSGDYHLMLQLFKEAFLHYGEAEEQLRKLDDYLWILGTIQGKLACTAVSQDLNLSNHDQYIDHLINQSYAIAKKVKNWNFECQNFLKVTRLYLHQPEKLDELIRIFISNYGKALHEDQKFLLFTVIGQLYQKAKLYRKKNLFYFLASQIHLSKKSQLSQVLLLQIQKQRQIKQSPYLYKQLLKMIIASSESSEQTSQYYLQLLSRCGNNLNEEEIDRTLAELNFSNHQIMQLEQIDFIKLRFFQAEESNIKPKFNRIGNRKEGQLKTGPGFFISWKKDQNLLFEENQEIVFRGAVFNMILFPIRLKISFAVRSVTDENKILSIPQLFCFVQPNSLHKFESKVKLKGATEEIWKIDTVELSVWNFKTKVTLPHPIKFEIYEKQPQISLCIDDEIKCQESSNLYIEAGLKVKSLSIPFCLIKLSISVYYTVDVGFQQNQIILKAEDNFKGIEFTKSRNLKITEGKYKDQVKVDHSDGCLIVHLKKLKVHRKFVGRVEFNLEYIRDMQTKYQSLKHYVSKCSFYQEFNCQIEEISTPTIEKIYKNPLPNLKIIEKTFKVKLKFTKLNHNKSSNSYKIYHDDNEYRFREDNTLTITFCRDKLTEQIIKSEFKLKQVVAWENIFSPLQRGQMNIDVPFHELMKQCEREVSFKIIGATDQHQKNQKKIIQYCITSKHLANLSHEITVNALQLEVDRMFMMVGKNKVEAQNQSKVENKITVVFSNKCKNTYQLGILFKDGWNYWHHELITIP